MLACKRANGYRRSGTGANAHQRSHAGNAASSERVDAKTLFLSPPLSPIRVQRLQNSVQVAESWKRGIVEARRLWEQVRHKSALSLGPCCGECKALTILHQDRSRSRKAPDPASPSRPLHRSPQPSSGRIFGASNLRHLLKPSTSSGRRSQVGGAGSGTAPLRRFASTTTASPPPSPKERA